MELNQISTPELDLNNPLYVGLSVHFQQYSPSVYIWKFLKDGSLINLEKNTHTRKILKEQYHTIRKRILACILSVNESGIIIESDDHGKPILIQPEYPLHFSISYTRSCWVFVVSLSGAIGVDIEDIQADSGILKIARKFFSPSEWDYISHLSIEKKIPAFYQFWTLKEAYLKATGIGLAGIQDLPDLSAHIQKLQETKQTTFILKDGFMADIQKNSSVCQAMVFRIPDDSAP